MLRDRSETPSKALAYEVAATSLGGGSAQGRPTADRLDLAFENQTSETGDLEYLTHVT